MKYISILFLIYCFLKVFYYGIFELKYKKNKSGGIAVIIIAITGLILPISILLLFY